MIISVEMSSEPLSGEYEEVIYDISYRGKSNRWTWIKFIDDDFSEWYGEFRGEGRGAVLSKKYNTILILTSDFIYVLDCVTKQIIEYDDSDLYNGVEVTPSGDFILSDYYGIEVVGEKLEDKEYIQTTIQLDRVKLCGWNNNKLLIECEEFLNWDNKLKLEFDGDTFEIREKSK